MSTLCKLSQTETHSRPRADKMSNLSNYAWSDGLGVLVGYNMEKNSKIVSGMHLETIKDSQGLAKALNQYSNQFFGKLKGQEFMPGEDLTYVPFNYRFMAPMKNIRRHQHFAYIKPKDEYIVIRFIWDEKI